MHRVSVLVPLSTGCYTVWDAALVCVSVSVCVCWQIRESATENSCRCSAAARFFWSTKSKWIWILFLFCMFPWKWSQILARCCSRNVEEQVRAGRKQPQRLDPRRECLFPSPIYFVFRPFQFLYIWPRLERDSLLIYCLDFLRVPLRAHELLPTAHPPFLGLAMTSSLLVAGF